MKVLSPFNEGIEGVILKKVSTQDIISGYKRVYDVDVTQTFQGLNEVYLCECPVTKMQYYYPFNLDGTADFYNALSQKDWYYHNERWEHNAVLNFIKSNDVVLEIGSGAGSFIKQLKDRYKDIQYCGLELNPSAIERAKLKNVILRDELLDKHVLSHQNFYSVVCSFQVFEHVSSIDVIFKDSIKALKQEGILIVAVPNNDALFIKNNTSDSKYLNMPPHHTNLFTEQSMHGIAKHYNLELVDVLKEPIQDMHVDIYLHDKISRIFFNISFFIKAFWKLKMHVPLRYFVKKNREKIIGHTIIAIYKKR